MIYSHFKAEMIECFLVFCVLTYWEEVTFTIVFYRRRHLYSLVIML